MTISWNSAPFVYTNLGGDGKVWPSSIIKDGTMDDWIWRCGCKGTGAIGASSTRDWANYDLDHHQRLKHG